MSSILHNKKLRQLLEQSDARVDAATSTADLLEVIKQLRDFGAPLAFDNATPRLFRNIGLGLIAATLLFIPFVVLGIAFLLGGWLVMDHRSGVIDALSKKITHKSSLLTHGLRESFSPEVQVLERLGEEFKDFHRGSYSRQILKSVQGTFLGAVHALPFTYQHLQYVDRESYKTTVPDGVGGTKVETKNIDQEFARHSLVLDFPWVENVVVRGDRHWEVDLEEALDTASSEFNSAFHLTGSTQMACAVFAKPATVLHLLQLHQQLSDVNLEFSEHGRLCLSCSDPGLLAPSATEGLQNLHLLLSWVHRLAELHDDNFALSPKPLKKMEH
jgi:hypothetical protein